MVIKIQNFGFIKEVEFDLSNGFTLIYGKNNIGKSYALYVVYLVLKSFSRLNGATMRSYYHFDIFFNEKIKVESKDIKDAHAVKHQTEELLKKVFEKFFLIELENYFKNTFSSIDKLQNRFCDEKLKITIELGLLQIKLSTIDEHLVIENIRIKKKNIVCKQSGQNRNNKLGKEDITVYLVENTSDEISSKINELVFSILKETVIEVYSKVSSLHFLPASRSGLYQALSAFGQIIAELSKNRQFFKSSIEIPGLSEPVSDYFISLSSIDNKKIKETDVVRIAREIEENILHGEVKFDTKTKKIFYSPKSIELPLDLSYTSSMVSELSPIVSYLKHIISSLVEKKTTSRLPSSLQLETKTLIFIEEPEAHLHPKVQVELLKYFVELTKYGIKVIMTTHSNYMFNKFNNLIASETLPRDSVSSILFEETKEGSIGRNVEIDRFGADDSNFADVSEELYMEKMEIIKNINSKKG